MTSTGEATSPRLIFLDYLRIFAFSSVLIGHKFYDVLLSVAESSSGLVNIAAKSVLPVFWGGGAGVVVFFLVSGYVIGHVLLKEATGEFLLKRFFRIYPLYVLAVLLQIGVAYFYEKQPLPTFGTVAAQLSLLGDWFQAPLTLNGVEWTLRLEIFFYGVMALIKSAGFLNDRRRLLPMALVMITAVIYLLGPLPQGTFPYPDYISVFAPLLFLGLLALLVERGEFSASTFVLLSAAALGRLAFVTDQAHPSGFAFFGAYAFAIFCTVWLARARLKSSRIVLILSSFTYSIYLFHNWAWDPMKSVLQGANFGVLPLDLQVLVAVLALCYVMSRTVERGGIALSSAILKRRRSSVAAPRT
jgi:peptidoglycan/LPS O-acetylase OafA/YrhL